MFKTAAFAIVITAMAWGTAAATSAPPASLWVSFYGAEKTPDIDPADGSVHAFMCLSPDKAIGPADECFAFRPKPEAVNLLKFRNGGSIAKAKDLWVESPGGFHFSQKSLTRERLVIVDASRGITWSLPLSKGVSTISTATASGAGYRVVAIGYDASPAGYVAGPQVAVHAMQDNPARPGPEAVVFERRIDPRFRTDIYSIVNRWNAKPRTLGGSDCMDLLDALAATVGAKRPPHVRTLGAAAYVGALIKLNP